MSNTRTLLVCLGLTCVACAPSQAQDNTHTEGKVNTQPQNLKDLQPEEVMQGLDAHAVAGKITIFDFHASACIPCTQLDEHLQARLSNDNSLVVRKIEVEGWDSPLVERYLENVDDLPFIIVYNRAQKRVGSLTGFKVAALDELLSAANSTNTATANTNTQPASTKKTHFAVTIDVDDVKAGADGQAKITVAASGGFKINQEYPWSASLQDTDGITLAEKKFTKTAWSLDAKNAALSIPFKATQAGKKAVQTQLNFSVCSEERCEIVRDHKVTLNVAVH